MKRTVLYGGRVYHRDSVEQSLKAAQDVVVKMQSIKAELDKPEPLKNLTRVRRKKHGTAGVVIFGSVQQHYVKGFNGPSTFMLTGDYTVVHDNGEGSTYGTEAALLDQWEIVEC